MFYPICTDFMPGLLLSLCWSEINVSNASRFIINIILIIETESCKKQSVSKIRTIKEILVISVPGGI